MKYFIITGASRGLGEAIVRQLFDKHHTFFCISRKQNNKLKEVASEEGINLYSFSCDLKKNDELEKVMERIFSTINFSEAEGIYLINNAGTVDPIKPAGKEFTNEISDSIHVNLIAPMILSSIFINQTKDIATKKIIVNITSGAANRPTFGWSTYSSSKAGLNMYTESVGLEQQSATNPVTMIAFSPGIMDTDMQKIIRSSEKDDFTDVERFIDFKEKGMLRTPEYVAGVLLNLMLNEEPINGHIYDIKSYIS